MPAGQRGVVLISTKKNLFGHFLGYCWLSLVPTAHTPLCHCVTSPPQGGRLEARETNLA